MPGRPLTRRAAPPGRRSARPPRPAPASPAPRGAPGCGGRARTLPPVAERCTGSRSRPRRTGSGRAPAARARSGPAAPRPRRGAAPPVRRRARAAPRGAAEGERPRRPRVLRRPSTELLGQADDDVLGAADVAEPVGLLVLRDLADEFGAAAPQAGDGVVDVVD